MVARGSLGVPPNRCRARGDARPDSDLDLLVVMPQTTLTPQERQQVLRLLRAALRPLPLSVGVDLVVTGEEDASHDGTGSTPCKPCLDRGCIAFAAAFEA